MSVREGKMSSNRSLFHCLMLVTAGIVLVALLVACSAEQEAQSRADSATLPAAAEVVPQAPSPASPAAGAPGPASPQYSIQETAPAAPSLPDISRGKKAPAFFNEIQKGYQYLEKNYNPDLTLVYESRDDSNAMLQRTYWLVNDNLLASLVLQNYNPELSDLLMKAVEFYGYKHDHYIEILFDDGRNDPRRAVAASPQLITRDGDRFLILSEKLTDKIMVDYDQYCDKLCYTLLFWDNRALPENIPVDFEKALRMWDGKGFSDRAYSSRSGYSTYKLALFYYTAQKLNLLHLVSFQDALISTLIQLQNPDNGGFHTFYDFDSQGRLVIKGSTNTETTCLALLALTTL